MMEIYRKHSFEYDELTAHEDYRNNLPAYLNSAADFSGKTVIEAGCGTGRMTGMYIDKAAKAFCYDGSAHMLEKAKLNLSAYSDKLSYGLCDNLELGTLGRKADIVLQGWSFGHTVIENEAKLEETVDRLVTACLELLDGGDIIFIESLRTNARKPSPPTDVHRKFYSLLTDKYGFMETVLETDYLFESKEEARRIMGFFFGEEMGKNLDFTAGGCVREFTGAYHFSR